MPLPKKLDGALAVSKFQETTLIINFTKSCRSSTRVTISLITFLVDLDSGFFTAKVFTGGNVGADRFLWKIPSRQMGSYGTYYVQFDVRMDGIDGTEHSDFGFVEIIYSPLVVKISGEGTFSQGLYQIANFSGALSYDPDVGQGDYSGMNFTWACKRREESFPENLTSLPVVNPPEVIHDSLGEDKGGCYGSGVGLLAPKQFPYHVELDVDKMKGKQVYDIQLLLTKDQRKNHVVHAITVKKEINLFFK